MNRHELDAKDGGQFGEQGEQTEGREGQRARPEWCMRFGLDMRLCALVSDPRIMVGFALAVDTSVETSISLFLE